MLSTNERSEAVATLLEAERSRQQAERLSQSYPSIDIDDAYAISRGVAEARADAGDVLIGHKVGLTSKAMRAASKIDEPDYGHVFASMLIEDGATVSHADYCVPRVEPELTFILKTALRGPNLTLEDVLAATEWVVPSIEIIDARVTEPRRIFDTVADNGAAAGLVLGAKRFRPESVDWRWASALFRRNDEIEETGVAAGVMDHPANAVAWLGNKLADFNGKLDAGHMVLSGSFTRPVWADRGDKLEADFGPLGCVTVSFS
ncbi:2-oxo-hepta-3-ene-1,7-dioic acid hydratase [Halocynthiibacter sp. C4]|uniref:2-keto-4-pentenoate hydratase n=1 Tax=Halocynthiibacter sp. C4 TaxID=2992758 RepID=UPI00237C1417|nr:fumarylacetoacetate hydrolase family protein [Halocynthiibacter sp. C4]MDE0589091.1 2-oxo-hepta-3-ene-1,7-dioic acid hydratase [Halocynthiibacter sp. C4]